MKYKSAAGQLAREDTVKSSVARSRYDRYSQCHCAVLANYKLHCNHVAKHKIKTKITSSFLLIVKLGSRSKVYLKSLLRDLDLELVAIIAMSPPPP